MHGISSHVGRPTNLGPTAPDHPHIKHAKASMTLDVYADLFDADLDDVAVNLDAAIRAAAAAAREDATQ